MRRYQIAIIIMLFLSLTGVLLFIGYRKYNIRTMPVSNSTPSTLSFNDFIQYKTDKMSIEEKRGMMFMVSIPDTVLSAETAKFLNDRNIGGVILLKHNIQNSNQLKKLTSDLRNQVNPHILIAIDQEGGDVVRIPWDKYAGVSARDMGQNYSLDQIYDIELYRANLLKDLGINVILGPVADVADKGSFIYRRSYGSNPDKVAQIVSKIIEAHNKAGIISIPKHFPGHGRTPVDSHIEFPVISLTKEELKNYELKPFQAAIDQGAQLVMLSHILNPNIDKNLPASKSESYVRILEDEMKYEGLVITDDLKMTGKIEGGIDWGINLTIESQNKVIQRLNSINPENKYVSKLLVLKYQRL